MNILPWRNLPIRNKLFSFLKMIAGKNQHQDSVGMSNSCNQSNFPSSFKVNYYFLRALGLWPFSFVRDPSGKIQKPKVTKIDFLWFIISTLLYLSTSIVFFKISLKFATKFEQMNDYVLNITNRVDFIRIVFSFIFVALLISIDMFNRFKLVNVLETFAKFDESVRILLDAMPFFYKL